MATTYLHRCEACYHEVENEHMDMRDRNHKCPKCHMPDSLRRRYIYGVGEVKGAGGSKPKPSIT